MQKYGEWLSGHEERFTEAPLPYIAINEADTAVQILTENEEYEDAKLVRALKVSGAYVDIFGRYEEHKDYDEDIDHQEALKRKKDLNQDEQLIDLTQRQAQQYFKGGQAILSSCSFLSINDYKNALIQLIKANELFLAYVLAYFLYPEGLKDVIIKLALRAERNMLVDEAKKLHEILGEEGEYYKTLMLCRLSMQGLYDSDKFHEDYSNTNFSFEMPQDVRDVLTDVVSENIQKGCEASCSYFRSVLEKEDFDNIKTAIEIFEIIQQVQISKVHNDTKMKVFGYLSVIGLCKAIWHGFILIVPGLLH
jgi:hypothetical protein